MGNRTGPLGQTRSMPVVVQRHGILRSGASPSAEEDAWRERQGRELRRELVYTTVSSRCLQLAFASHVANVRLQGT